MARSVATSGVDVEVEERVFAEVERRLGRPLTDPEKAIDIVGNSITLERAKDALQAEIQREMGRVAALAAEGRPERMRVTDRMVSLLNDLYEAGAEAAAREMEKLGIAARRDYVEMNPRVGDVEARLRSLLGSVTPRVHDEGISLSIGEASRGAIARSVERNVPGGRDIASRLVSGAFARGLGATYEQNRELFPCWHYSAVMDGATCSSCRSLDGTEYPTWEAILSVLPGGGPNPSCFGDGRCRCRPVPCAPDVPLDVRTPIPEPDPGFETGPLDVLTDPDGGADAFIRGLRETERRRGVIPDEEEIAKARESFRKKIAKSIDETPDPDVLARLSEIDEFNRRSDVYVAATNRYGRDRVLVLRQGEGIDPLLSPGRDVSAAHRLTGNRVTVVRRDALDELRDGPIVPGGISSIERGGTEALMRHEYGHQLWQDLTPVERDSFRALWPKDTAADGELHRTLTRYATTKDEEAFCEAFAIVTDPEFDPLAWDPWVREFRAKMRATLDLEADLPPYPPGPLGEIMRARDELPLLDDEETKLLTHRNSTPNLVAETDKERKLIAINGYPSNALLRREEAIRDLGRRIATEVDERVAKALGVKSTKQLNARITRSRNAYAKALKAEADVYEAVGAELREKLYPGRTLGSLSDRDYDALDRAINADDRMFAAFKAKTKAWERHEINTAALRDYEIGIHKARSEAILDVMDDLGIERGGEVAVGDVDEALVNALAHRVTGTAEAEAEGQVAARLYPRSWIDASNELGHVRFARAVDDRGFYGHHESSGDAFVVTSPRKGRVVGINPVAIHELGHRMERVFPQIRAWQYVFHSRRTHLSRDLADRERRSLKEMFPHSTFRADEFSYPDKFVDAYVGKPYGSGDGRSSWEVFTVGIESVFTGSYDLWAVDPEHRDLVLGLLFGLVP